MIFALSARSNLPGWYFASRAFTAGLFANFTRPGIQGERIDRGDLCALVEDLVDLSRLIVRAIARRTFGSLYGASCVFIHREFGHQSRYP